MNQPPAQSYEVRSIKPVRRRLKAVGGVLLIVSLLGLATLRGRLLAPQTPQPVAFETARSQLHAVLSELKSELNGTLQFHNGYPRAEMGPCGPLARQFCESWNERFSTPTHIAFVKCMNNQICRHVLVWLQDDFYYDMGRGVMTEAELNLLYGEDDPTVTFEIMTQFDEPTFDANSVKEPYNDCPNYSPGVVRSVIDRHLDRLRLVLQQPAIQSQQAH